MANDRHGYFTWPGIRSPREAKYTTGHGTAPGIAVLTINPQPGFPISPTGDLVITDGVGTITIPDCKITKMEEIRDDSGLRVIITVQDRRWRWRECGGISLFANQLDPHGKFIPWTVASPVEMATFCLQQMGEENYSIDMPVGLTTAAAQGRKEFLPTGINFPPTGVNPPINWEVVKPMLVLDQLADSFGRVIVWRWSSDSVLVTPRGTGASLPAGSIKSISPGVTNPDAPDGICVVGSPTRFQCDFELQAMGEEWDGTFVPINALSYSPKNAATFHTFRITGVWSNLNRYYLTISPSPDLPTYTYNVDGSTVSSNLQLYQAFAALINADPNVNKIVNTNAAVTSLTVKANTAGVRFDMGAYTHLLSVPTVPPSQAPAWRVQLTALGDPGQPDWSRCHPPLYHGVRATARLTLTQARALAQKSVWKYYQLTGRDLAGDGKINVPGYGRVDRYRIVLLDEMCEQVVPVGGQANAQMKDGTPVITNYYNGFSRAKPAAVFGAVKRELAQGIFYAYDPNQRNTLKWDQVVVPFSVDPTFFMIRFNSPVYKFGPSGTFLEPTLRLRTACHIRNELTGALERFSNTIMFPGATGTNLVYEKHEDVQVNVIPSYLGNRSVAVNILEADPLLRSQYYAEGAVFKYVPKASLVNIYNGIMEIDLDGAISQVTWEVGPGGARTTASLNYEHNSALPPYPARRRAELLAAAVAPGGFLGQVGDRAAHLPPFMIRTKG